MTGGWEAIVKYCHQKLCAWHATHMNAVEASMTSLDATRNALMETTKNATSILNNSIDTLIELPDILTQQVHNVHVDENHKNDSERKRINSDVSDDQDMFPELPAAISRVGKEALRIQSMLKQMDSHILTGQ